MEWLRQLLVDLRIPAEGATIINEDNQGCIRMIELDRSRPRTKHIDVCHHHQRDLRERGIIDVVYCPTGEMSADIFTKPLAKDPFMRCRGALGMSG